MKLGMPVSVARVVLTTVPNVVTFIREFLWTATSPPPVVAPFFLDELLLSPSPSSDGLAGQQRGCGVGDRAPSHPISLYLKFRSHGSHEIRMIHMLSSTLCIAAFEFIKTPPQNSHNRVQFFAIDFARAKY
jgi:hypothetical protein